MLQNPVNWMQMQFYAGINHDPQRSLQHIKSLATLKQGITPSMRQTVELRIVFRKSVDFAIYQRALHQCNSNTVFLCCILWNFDREKTFFIKNCDWQNRFGAVVEV